MKYFPILLGILLLSGCAVHPKKTFDASQVAAPPNYSELSHWAAHPDKADLADRTPDGLKDEQATSDVDVFFLYPTTYTGSKRAEKNWNADVNDENVNKKTDESSILFQASIFNGAGRVFAPRYRQAHLHVFFTKKDTSSAREALDVAYADVKAAFEYYLEHWNQGRPFIIAGHSQGARHAMLLIRELIENKPLEQQLVAGYIVGWPVKNTFFKKIRPCATPEETGCFCTWRTWERNYGLRKANERSVICTNPLIWSITEGQYAHKSFNTGAVIRPFSTLRPQVTDAEVYRGFLLANKPKFPGSVLLVRKNYHVGDLNLFYLNVRENAQTRTKMYLKARK
jgi:Protein of unknown function (DUF3089)